MTVAMAFCQIAGAEAMPNGNLRYLNNPKCVLIVRYCWLSVDTFICLYARAKSNLVKDSPFAKVKKTSVGMSA